MDERPDHLNTSPNLFSFHHGELVRMDPLLLEHERLVKKGNLSKSIDDVQATINLLAKARKSIASGKGHK